MKLMRISLAVAVCSTLGACASGGGGGTLMPVAPKIQAPVLEPIPPAPDSLSGKQTQTYRGENHYFYNGVEISESDYQTKSGHQIDSATLASRFENQSITPATPVNTSVNHGLYPSMSIDSAYNDDVKQAWLNGWQGQNVVVQANNGITTILQSKVAPKIFSNSEYPQVKISDINEYAVHYVPMMDLDQNGIVVGSRHLVNDFMNKTGKKAEQTLPVTSGHGIGQEFGIPEAVTHTEAVAVAGGYVALVMSKFNNLTGSQAGTVLKSTAVQSAEGGQNLSLRRALSPTGNLK
jgi:hypothetical protein